MNTSIFKILAILAIIVCVTNATSPILHYSFDNQNLQDESGQNNHGTNNGATFENIDGCSAVKVGSGNFFYHDSILDNTNDITISMWIRMVSGTCVFEAVEGQFQFILNTNQISLDYGGYGQRNSFNVATTQNQWNHWALVRQGSSLKTYKNGVEVNNWALPIGQQVTLDSSRMYFGACGFALPNTATGAYFNGHYDSVQIFNSALSATEIQAITVATCNFISCTVPHCDTCVTGNTNVCQTCEAGYFLKDGLCVADCGAGYFGSFIDNECHACNFYWTGSPAVPASWCAVNCFVPGTQILAPACRTDSGVHQRCNCHCTAATNVLVGTQSNPWDQCV